MISVVISWRNRAELGEALPSLVEQVSALDGEITVVNYSGDERELLAQLGAPNNRLQVLEVPDERFFNKAACQNLGASVSSNEVLFFCDCDIKFNDGIISTLLTQMSVTPNSFATLAKVKESVINARGANHVVSFGYDLIIKTADGRVLNIKDNEEDGSDGTRQAPGLLFVRQEDFFAVGGYNSNFHGWGWEDQDMISRLTLGRGLQRVNEGEAVHISHPDEARMKYYPQFASRWESRDRMFRAALANYDRADFMGTYLQDVERLRSRAKLHRWERNDLTN